MSNNIKKIRKMNNMYLLAIMGVACVIWTIIDPYAYGESDFTLEMKTDPISKVTQFTISGESDKEICPSGQCGIYTEGKYANFGPPSPDSMSIFYNIDFTLQDNKTNAELGPKKKEFMEQYSASMFGCMVDDIIEENGQELYYCHGDSTIDRKFDSKSWDYDTIGIYDAKNNTLKVYGNFTGNSPYSFDTSNSLNDTYTETNTETRTFEDCFSEGMGMLTLGLIFAPTEKLSATDLLDPAFKTTIINLCNFYHEKTGVWINLMSEEDRQYSQQYGEEFYQKYGDTIPEKLKQTRATTDWGTSSYTPPSSLGSNSSDPPYTGIGAGVNLDPYSSQVIGLNDTKGVLITNITKDSPAEKSGLRAGSNTTMYNDIGFNIGGDIIQKIDDREVSHVDDITTYVESQKNIGDNVTFTILRDNATKKIDVTLGQWPIQVIGNPYFNMTIPNSWTYVQYSNTPEAQTTGSGTANSIQLAPSEFSDLLNIPDQKYWQKIKDRGATAYFKQDTEYRIENAPLESYVKYAIDRAGVTNITSQQYTTVGNEKSVSLYINDKSYGNLKRVFYIIMHDEQPYMITYTANAKNYEKYLPEFEQMVKNFRFTDSQLSEIEKSENENLTGTKTNFSSANTSEFNIDLSSANLSELYTNATNNSNNPEELYDECVNVAGKDTCDFLFKR